MGRQPQPGIKARLLDACTDHALAHGLPDRLEPFATASGTSPRMLVYHFGGRDPLQRAVLAHARRRQLDLFGNLLQPRENQSYLGTLERAWTTLAGPEGQQYVRLFGPLRSSTERLLWPGFRREATTDWLPILADGLGTLGRPELATLALAVIRGLLTDLDATGDAARNDEAFHHFVALLR